MKFLKWFFFWYCTLITIMPEQHKLVGQRLTNGWPTVGQRWTTVGQLICAARVRSYLILFWKKLLIGPTSAKHRSTND